MKSRTLLPTNKHKAGYAPRVLFFINKWKTGGAENLLRDQMNTLERQGIDVYFGAVYGDELPSGVERVRSVFPRFKNLLDIAAYVRFLSLMRIAGITHVVAVLDNAMIATRLAAFFMPNVKVVVMEVGMADRKPWRYKVLDVLLNFRVKGVTASSDGVRKSLLTYQSIHARKIVVIHNGIPIPTPRPKALPHEGYVVLAVGSLRREKGFSMLIDAFDLFIEKTYADAKLVIVGGGVLEGALKQQAASLPTASRIHFAGELSLRDVHEWYRRADCFVLSSISEGFGLVLAEAMSYGVPAISARSAGGLAIVEDEVSGLLAKSNDVRSLSDALIRLYKDGSLRDRFRIAGYERVRELFGIERNTELMRRLLEL